MTYEDPTDETPGPPQPPICGVLTKASHLGELAQYAATDTPRGIWNLTDPLGDDSLPEACPFCEAPPHFGACEPMLAYVEGVKHGMLLRTARYLCNGCGDPVNHDGLCQACVEDAGVVSILTIQTRAAVALALEVFQ